MSAPHSFYNDRIDGARNEIISAMSALNMDPHPMAEPEGEWLSQSDHWVKHSLEHLYAALEQLKGESMPTFKGKSIHAFVGAIETVRGAAIHEDMPIEDGSIASLHWLSAISLLEQATYQMHLAALTNNPSHSGANE